MLLNLQTKRTWIPEILDNDKQPEGDRIEISYIKPPAYARNAWERRIARRNAEGKPETYVELDVAAVIKGSDVKIRHLQVIIDGAEKPTSIETGDQLVDVRSDFCWLLATSLANEIVKPEIQGELIKNSASDSGASS